MIVAGASVAGAGIVGLLARRWPSLEAPQLSNATIAREVEQHPGIARRLRRHFDPSKETGVALTVAATVVGAAALGVGVLSVTIRARYGLSSVDVRIARFAADHATSLSTRSLRAVSMLGGTPGVIAISVGAIALELVRRPTRAVPAFMTTVVVGQLALSNGIKFLVARARPDFSRLTGFAGSSFPSGHSTAAAATLAAIALITTRGGSDRTKVLAASVATGLTIAVASSRVFLGVHWFSDVLGGAMLGWGWFALCSIAFGGRLLTFGEPVATAERVAGRAG